MLHHAKRRAKEANQALEAVRKAQLNPSSSQASSPNVLNDTIYRDAETGEMEPGLEEIGNMAGIEESGSREAGFREGAKPLLSIGKVGNQDAGGKRETSIVYRDGRELGKDASQPLQSSESLAATLIQQHMAQLAQESIMQALQRAHASIHAAPQSLPIATITDLRSAAKMAMELTGMDKTTNNTQLNILVSPTPKSGTWNFSNESELPAIDVE
jgi:hypothetical protein